VKEKVNRKWTNWYQNEVDKEIEEFNSRDKVTEKAALAYDGRSVSG